MTAPDEGFQSAAVDKGQVMVPKGRFGHHMVQALLVLSMCLLLGRRLTTLQPSLQAGEPDFDASQFFGGNSFFGDLTAAHHDGNLLEEALEVRPCPVCSSVLGCNVARGPPWQASVDIADSWF